jgi:hypothetical protein
MAPVQIRLLVCCALLIAAGIGFLGNGQNFLRDPDTLWHVTLGADIWATKSFPHVDAYSHTFAGEPWIAKEWLSQMLIFAAHSAGGWNGVILLAVAALLTALVQVYWPLSSKLNPVTAAVIALAAIMLSREVLWARPHVIVLPVLIWFVYSVWSAARENRTPSFILLLAMCLWANMHGSFTFGFAVAGLSFLYFLNGHRKLRSTQTYRWLIFLALCPVAAMVHPYGYEAIWSTIVVAKSEALPYISEWRAFSAQKDVAGELVILGLIGLFALGRLRLNIFTVIFLCFLLHMYLTHFRFMYLFFLLTPLLLADGAGAQIKWISYERWKDKAGTTELGRAFAILSGPFLIVTAALTAFAFVFAGRHADWTPAETYPVAAIEAARAAGVSGKVMNYYGYGGALIYERIPTFVDGRADRLFQNGFVEEINQTRLAGGEEMLKDHIEKYDISWSIYPARDGRVKLLDKMSGWERLYGDDRAVVHAKE